MQVNPGDRVTIHGLTGRTELNGTSGILIGPAANGRINIKLDSGETVSLKQSNLGVAQPGGGGGGMPGGGMPGGFGSGGMPGGFGRFMPGAGGMPGGFGGGMPGMPPGGLPNVLGAAVAAMERMLATAGVRLPPGVTAGKAAAGLAFAAAAALYILSYFVSFMVLCMVGFVAFVGTQTPNGRIIFGRASAKASGMLGRPVQSNHLVGLTCVAVVLLGRTYSSGSGVVATPATDAYGLALREAYQQGYDDALNNRDPRPPKHIPGPEYDVGARESSSSGSGFGIWSLMRYAMIAQYIHRAGAGPGGWSPQMFMANMQANPMQAVMMLMMLSGSGIF